MTETPAKPSAATVYCAIMGEIKDRVDAIDRSRELHETGEHPYALYLQAEFCILQLRMVCELIAIATVVAHDGIPATRSARLQKQYHAADILAAMEEIHPDFYPSPVTVESDLTTKIHHVREIEAGYLSKIDLKRLYYRCGELLHRGQLKDFLFLKPRIYPSGLITPSVAKIVRLLETHAIKIIGEDQAVLVTMSGEDGMPQWFNLSAIN